MKIEFTDEEAFLLLGIVGKYQEYLQGKDNSNIDSLIQTIVKQLKEAGKEEIFHKVFVEYEVP
ncbi:MAG TPA: hypothetical protein VKZ95_08725 [Sphingobacteriaceae bacterium]|nr:hypothetical protein [Sphingobacteriaceae bacterium]